MMDLDLNAFYFHSIILGRDDTLEVLDSIFKSKKILSLNKGGFDDKSVRMNSRDEICLSKKNGFSISNSAYDLFATKKLTLIVKGNLPGVYRPSVVSERESFDFIEMGKTDLKGEYRVRNEIPLSYVVGLNLPASFILGSMFGYKYFFCKTGEMRLVKFVNLKTRENDLVKFYDDVVGVMKENNICLPIYDIESGIRIKDSSDLIKVKKKI